MRRGKIGGAVVHRPQPANAAYTFGLILRSRATSPEDVSRALAWAERSVPEGFPDPTYRQHGFDDRELILRLIERGEVDAVTLEARSHLEWAPVYSVDEEDQIAPSVLRPGGGR